MKSLFIPDRMDDAEVNVWQQIISHPDAQFVRITDPETGVAGVAIGAQAFIEATKEGWNDRVKHAKARRIALLKAEIEKLEAMG